MDDVSAAAETSGAVWERVLRIDLTAPFPPARAVPPHMPDAGGGSIVFTASYARDSGRPGTAEGRAAAIVFLASDAAADITGTVPPMDDDWSAVWIEGGPRPARMARECRSGRRGGVRRDGPAGTGSARPPERLLGWPR